MKIIVPVHSGYYTDGRSVLILRALIQSFAFWIQSPHPLIVVVRVSEPVGSAATMKSDCRAVIARFPNITSDSCSIKTSRISLKRKSVENLNYSQLICFKMLIFKEDNTRDRPN